MLVRFLAGRDEQARRSRKSAEPPSIPALYKDPEVLAANPYFSRVEQFFGAITLRPSGPAGKIYPEVSRAYFEAVHSVLGGRESAEMAARHLQTQLTRILAPGVETNARTPKAPAVSPR